MAPKYDISKIKQIGTFAKNTFEPLDDVKCDGYLLEIESSWYKQVETARLTNPEVNPDSISRTYELLAISLMGPKNACDSALRLQKVISLHVQKPGNHGEQIKGCIQHKRKDYFLIDPRKESYKLETEGEHVMAHYASLVLVTKEKEIPRMNITITGSAGKTETGEYRFVMDLTAGSSESLQQAISQLEKLGTVSDLVKTTSGSLYRRVVAINPKIKAENLNGDSTEGYLIGENHIQARGQFWNVLDKLPAPIQPEWEEELWKRFTAYGSDRIAGVHITKWREEHDITDEEFGLLIEMQPWVDECVGHRMFGYKLNLNKEAIQLLISALVYSDVLPNCIPATTSVSETEETEQINLAA